MSSIASAIASAEGYGIPGAIPTLANNPGDLVLGNQGNGTLGNGITVFSTPQAGLDALNNQINLIQSGQSSVYTPNETIAQIGNTWSGGNPNWANNVSTKLGVSPNSSLPTVSNNPSPFSWAGIKTLWSGMAATQSFAGLPIANTKGQLINAPVKNGVSYQAYLPRMAAGIIGLIAIGAGLFMLKSTQTIIQTAGSVAKAAVS